MENINDHLVIPNTNLVPQVGRLLISTPYFNDLFFNRSVVLLTDADNEGSSGLIINKQLPFSVHKMTQDIRVEDGCYFGGPVLQEAIFLLHNYSNSKTSSSIIEGVNIGYDQKLLSIIEHHAIANLKYKFFVGYSGWSPGQLEDEILRGMWVVSECSSSIIFNTPSDRIWSLAVERLGEQFSHWLYLPRMISYN